MRRAGRAPASSRGKLPAAAGPDCAAAFQRIALDCIAGIRAHHRRACAGDAEALHQVRVAITRLRAVVLFFEPIVVDTEWPSLKKEIGWVNDALGAARDDDVMAAHARRKQYRVWSRGAIGEHLAERRRRDHRRLVRCLRAARFQNLIAALSGWVRHGRWLARWERAVRYEPPEPLHVYGERELNRWRKRLIRKGRHLKTLGGFRRHRLRIRAKRLRYMLEALADIVAIRGGEKYRRLHRSARRLQSVLGDLRDLDRFADLAALASAADDSEQGKSRPPGYRRDKDKLLRAAIEAYHSFKQADAG
ncbi:MAG: CHAD domain-containing protein [Bradyrhizobium sp.]